MHYTTLSNFPYWDCIRMLTDPVNHPLRYIILQQLRALPAVNGNLFENNLKPICCIGNLTHQQHMTLRNSQCLSSLTTVFTLAVVHVDP